MKKLNVLWLILGSIVFIMFNMVFFLTGMRQGDPFPIWATYSFIVVSFAVFAATPFLTERYTIKRRIFGIMPTEFGAVYFAVQLVLGSIYILSGFKNYTPAFLIPLFLLAGFAVSLIVNLIISEKVNITHDKED